MSLKPSFQPSNRQRLFLRGVCIMLGVFAMLAPFMVPSVGTVSAEPAGNPAGPLSPPPGGWIKYDFTGDGKADVGRWKATTTEFKIKSSSSGAFLTYTLGTTAAKAAPGDFNGDGLMDPGVFAAGTWTYKLSPNINGAAQTKSLGAAGDIPAAGDYDGDGTTDPAVFRPSNGHWYVRESSTNNVTDTNLNLTTDTNTPIAGDYDWDGKTDKAVYRSAATQFVIAQSTGGTRTITYGATGDIPLTGDFDGDQKPELVLFRPSTGRWSFLRSQNNYNPFFTTGSFEWGNYGDQPVPADYDGDGLTDFAIWRPTTGVWHILNSSDGKQAYQTIGLSTDTAVPSAYTRQIGSVVVPATLAEDRLRPKNATGGTNLYSQNFAWGTSLVDLPGRSGMNVGFDLAYNSLVWLRTQSGTPTMAFDPDTSNLSPGFRFGFPVVEPAYYSNYGGFAYLMVNPDGSRVEFKSLEFLNVYSATDSSYAELVTTGDLIPSDPEAISMTLTTKDGTQTSFEWKAGAFRCSKIQDRNGNYITITHNSEGLLTKVIDTLGREINVTYDAQLYPLSITQTWKDGNGAGPGTSTHTWATFSYTTKIVATNFGSLINAGPPNGTVIKVLDKVTYADTSWTKFTYNGYIQVIKVENYADDDHLLNYVSTNLDAVSGTQPDCPRFTETRTMAEQFNNGNPVTVVNDAPVSATYNLPDGHNGPAAKIRVAVTGHPNGLYTNTYVRLSAGYSGPWDEGLTLATEECLADCSGANRKRWTWNQWTHDDNIAAVWPLNPRIIENRVGDATNIKGTLISYFFQTLAPSYIGEYRYGLPVTIETYDTNPSNVRRRTTISYNLSAEYLTRRIIGLPESREEWGWNSQTQSLEHVSSVTYGYDQEGFNLEPNQNISNVINHDNTNYSASFVQGRGNLTTVTRNDVTGTTSAAVTKIRYDIAGSVVAQFDPLNRKVAVNYSDSFNDNLSRNTYAYPTTVTDPGGFSSQIKYRFDIGANVWAKSPNLNASTTGKETTRKFEMILGRLDEEKVVNNGAYTRYQYFSNGNQVKSFSTLVDMDASNTGTPADEVTTETLLDGAGRVRLSRTEHPGSTGGWSASKTLYDKLGRVTSQSVPTEVDQNWIPAGDDAAGYRWTHQKYDWGGRVVRKINTDGIDQTPLNDSDVLISYDGCGCAGGQVTTIQSESVPRDDQPTVNARRVQKIYEDIQGRSFKTEVMNWDGTSVYTSTVQTYNGRDQVTNTKQYAGAVGSGTFQDVTMTYDGHGRMKTRHYPIENSGAATTWNYNADDAISQIIDPRGAITDFTYNNRALTTQIAYTPFSGGTDTPTTDFIYDNLGNRTSMDTAGVNATTYTYNELSQITSETVDFDDLSSNLTIGYTYNLSGGLKSVADPFNSTVDYTSDKTGRLTAVDGTAYAQNTTGDYASNIKYRAFGQVKQMDYVMPNGTSQIKLGYDSRLRVNHSETTQAGSTTSFLMKSDYSYLADGRVAAKDDLIDNKWDRTNKYDFAGRLKFNQFGLGLGSDSTQKRVYEQTIAYDAFSQMTSRSTIHWDDSNSFTETRVNGRIQNSSGLTYDAAGNIVHTGDIYSPQDYQQTVFDAAGRRTSFLSSDKGRQGSLLNIVKEKKTEQVFDGDGRPVVEKSGYRTHHVSNPPPLPIATVPGKYHVWSTVMGNALTTVLPNGNKLETKVFAGGAVIAKQMRFVDGGQTIDSIEWTTSDPVTGTVGRFSHNPGGSGASTEEAEPLGQKIDSVDLSVPPEPQSMSAPPYGNASEPEWQCQVPLEFQPYHCQRKAEIANSLNGMSIYSLYDPDKKPGDPTFINVNDPPLPAKEAGADDRVRTQTLHATDKPEDKSHDGSAVQPAQVPNDSGENDGDVDLENRTVTVRGGPSLPMDFADASVSSRGDVAKDLQQGLDAVRAVLTDPKNQDCLGLFKNLGTYGLKSAEELLNRYETNGWIKVSDRYPSSKGGKTIDQSFRSRDVGAVTTGGSYSYKNANGLSVSAAGITINKNGFYFSPMNSSGKLISMMSRSGFQGLNQKQIRAAIIIHELLHTIGAIDPDGPDEKDNGTKSNLNAQLVQDNCFRK